MPDLGMEGNVTSVDVVTAHPTEGLQTARETLLVEESLEMTEYDLQLRLAHDREFRHRFEKIPTGSNPLFDKRRNSILNEPIIAAHFRRMRLVPRYPFSNEVKQVYDLMHTKFSATADFLFEIFLTNVSVHPTTLQRITAEAEVEGKWVSLPLVNQFENYELTFDSDARFAGTAFTHMYAKAEPLKSIWDEVKGVVLERGVGYQGWVGFELVASSDAIDKPIPSRVRLIDALGGIHPVVTLAKDPPYETGRIRHSRKAYDALR
ncbi:MAG TPA: hypothetical protein VFN62_03680 [Acidobacteriaceae bacterium]|nr:hypothetical protein [Acidobacteriaceae bacterium]